MNNDKLQESKNNSEEIIPITSTNQSKQNDNKIVENVKSENETKFQILDNNFDNDNKSKVKSENLLNFNYAFKFDNSSEEEYKKTYESDYNKINHIINVWH